MTSTSETRGHLFVLHGLIQNFDYDAVIVPTDYRFDITSSWPESVTGVRHEIKPHDWPRPFARSATGAPIWFICVADEQVLSDEELVRRVTDTLTEIADSALAKAGSRELLRIAIPVLGIGRGGLGDQRGAILRSLLATLLSFTANNHIDVLLVASNRAVFSAAQHARRELAREGSPVWDLNDDEMGEARRLGGLAADGHLALFLGAGVSIAAGLPNWGDLLRQVGGDGGERPSDFKELGYLDKAEYLAVKMGADELNVKVSAAIGETTKVAVAHALLAAMNCREAVTTNYDALYERAVEATGRHRPIVLPWESVDPKREWLLKLHGDASRPATIVLTRRDFVLFDTKSKPAGSLLQALLLTKHLLIIGASLNDDNVIRLAMEVDEYLVRSGSRSARGTFVDVSGKPARQELWTQQFHWLICEGDSSSARARRMEILLDAVSAFATADAPWVLDERFDGLLPEQDRAVTEEARALLVAAESASGLIAPLRSALTGLTGERSEVNPSPAELTYVRGPRVGDRSSTVEQEGLIAELPTMKKAAAGGDRKAPYKYVVLLWAVSRVRAGYPRLVALSEVNGELSELLAPFRIAGSAPKPSDPWFRLESSTWWEIQGHGKRGAARLGGLSTLAYRLLHRLDFFEKTVRELTELMRAEVADDNTMAVHELLRAIDLSVED